MSYLVVGSGSIGRRHHANISALGGQCTLVGWRDFDRKSVELPSLTGMVIATATQVRLPLIALAAEAGVPLYIEKPIAVSPDDLERVLEVTEAIASRSVAGLMMRYHPVIRYLSGLESEILGFQFEIGHDVRQWRPNWRFADSYAARPDGGGVLLDLCHEIDMAACLIDGLSVTTVDCLGHEFFPGIDFLSRVGLAGRGVIGSVAMDYLSPKSTRRLSMFGHEVAVDVDLLSCEVREWRSGKTETKTWQFDRNDMFLGLMRDFMALAEGREPSDNPLLPRLDRVGAAARLVSAAWEKRTFRTHLSGDFQ